MIASWRYGSYRIMAAIVMVMFVVTGMAVTVSADYVTVTDYGFYYSNNTSVTRINVGDTIPLNKNPYSARWNISGLSPDYTYDIFLDVITESDIDFSKFVTSDSDSVFYGLRGTLAYTTDTASYWTAIKGMNGSIEKVSDKHVKFHLFYNYNISGLNYSSLQLVMNINCYAGAISNLKVVLCKF